MIRYALTCAGEHGFEAWFRDSASFDLQNGTGQVSCPVCGTSDVRKALMAPALRRSPRERSPSKAEVPTSLPAPEQAPSVPITDETFARTRAAIKDLHERLKRDAENVGATFPDQARRIHDGEALPRAIYGTATDDEVRSLLEDGVGILPIPSLPDDRN